MALSIIVAHDKKNGIGNKTHIPWHLPTDFKWFKEQTTGKCVVMGSTTYFSLPEKFRPLPGRDNLVLCNDQLLIPKIENEGAKVFINTSSIRSYLLDKDAFIIGGASIYEQFIGLVDKLYITKINKEFECDTFFPKVNYDEWIQTFKSNDMVENALLFSFNIYEKIKL
jgi:dihydrofolate reductase